MAEQKPRVIAIGEVMAELARGNDGRFGMTCGGDTFNTAVYLARAGIDVSYGACPASTSSRPIPRASDGSAIGAARRRRASCSSCPTGTGSPRA
jgi:hypothetical protein